MEANIAALSREQIATFFSTYTSVTRQQCDQEARRITSEPNSPSVVQGGTSYTVVAVGGSVIQFRPASYSLDLIMLACVEKTYSGFVPQHAYVGQLGELFIYRMRNVGGISMYLARKQLFANDQRLLSRTVEDYAKFFASAWNNTPAETPLPDHTQLHNQYLSQLSQLAKGLPPRFRPTLDSLIARLPGLFAEDWPMVPNHTDLLENNIHVDPESGEIKGICDWKDVEVSPFGMSISGLDTMLGTSTMTGWRYHSNHAALRARFWETFREAVGDVDYGRIETARLIGIFMTNSWDYDDRDNIVPAPEGSHQLRHLDGFILGPQASTSA